MQPHAERQRATDRSNARERVGGQWAVTQNSLVFCSLLSFLRVLSPSCCLLCLCFGRLAATRRARGETEGNEGETDEEHRSGGRVKHGFLVK
jgi:hypothetical protein